MSLASGELRREALRLIRRLAEPDHFVCELENRDRAGLFSPRNKWVRPVQTLDMRVVVALNRADLLHCRRPDHSCHPQPSYAEPCQYQLSDAGESWWRRTQAGVDPFRAQHQLLGQRNIKEAGDIHIQRQVNLGESPLGWLARRKGPDGQPFLSATEVEAGEKLRIDYTLASLSPKVTADWGGFLAHVDRSRGGAGTQDLSDAALDARRRVERAMRTVGPHLSDILLATCCDLAGLEQAEKSFGWPQRSAKIVLKIALGRLADHYGLNRGGRPSRKNHVWHNTDVRGNEDQSP